MILLPFSNCPIIFILVVRLTLTYIYNGCAMTPSSGISVMVVGLVTSVTHKAEVSLAVWVPYRLSTRVSNFTLGQVQHEY